mmetsp:Transcript_28155/g.24885  ORF Transcript_28155/g.24885 Transcript_28155/m.24885 type:complete len:112 (+) Transcript_28155:23-358(+)
MGYKYGKILIVQLLLLCMIFAALAQGDNKETLVHKLINQGVIKSNEKLNVEQEVANLNLPDQFVVDTSQGTAHFMINSINQEIINQLRNSQHKIQESNNTIAVAYSSLKYE